MEDFADAVMYINIGHNGWGCFWFSHACHDKETAIACRRKGESTFRAVVHGLKILDITKVDQKDD